MESNSEEFVKAVLGEKNVKARKELEKIIQSKCEKRIKEVLDS